MASSANGKGNGPGVHLVIPYFPGDPGLRPPPGAYPVWNCRSILIDGVPYGGELLAAGETLQLTVNAINTGQLPTLATVIFYWANPTTNFTTSTVNFIGSTTVSLPYNVLTPSSPIPWPIADDVPQHACLLAEVTAPSDVAPQDFDAGTDRHFGQQNVYLTAAPAGGQIRVGFFVGNNKALAGRYRVEATPILVHHDSFRSIIEPGSVLHRPDKIQLAHSPSDTDRDQHATHVDLGAGESRELEIRATVPADAVPGSVVILQLAQYREGQHQPVGGLGVIIRVT